MDSLPAIMLAPSRIALMLQRGVVILAAAAVLLSSVPWIFKSFLVFMLLALEYVHERHSGKPVISACGCEQAQWWAIVNEQRIMVEPVGKQLVLPWLVVLHLREVEQGSIHHLALWPDRVSADDLRCLRVFLRHAG